MHDAARAAGPFVRSPFAASVSLLAAALVADPAAAQVATPAQVAAAGVPATAPAPAQAASAVDSRLPAVVVTGRGVPTVSTTGFAEPLARTPIAATVIDAATLRDAGITRLSDAARLDPSVSDSYNSEGYISYFTVRGYALDNRTNVRRDGLPINGETSIPLDNKSGVAILKGTSGMQAGVSSPGGLIDLLVKRPLAVGSLTSATVGWSGRGTFGGGVDLSRRFGATAEGGAGVFGLRFNAAAERLEPELRAARGTRHLVALAGDARFADTGTLVEAEIEQSRREQPSQPGFSVLGDRVPEVADPRLNLNNQSWSQPNVFTATTGSLRVTQALGRDWKLVAQGVVQRLRTDDRLAFPFGCSSSTASYREARYCADGTFDFYDFRSDGERRFSHTLDLSLRGELRTGPLAHGLTLGAWRSDYRLRVADSAFNITSPGNIDGSAQVPAMPDPVGPQTNRDERSTKLYARDRIAFGASGAALWLGLRQSRVSRESVLTDGSGATATAQSFTTPFVAGSWELAPGRLVYASWGRGVETDVTPNTPFYATPGRPLPAAKSRQTEVGLKGATERTEWGLAAFDIARPLYADRCDPVTFDACVRSLDGTQRHRGLEAQGALRLPATGTTLRAAGLWMRARVEGTSEASLNGLRPVNVPTHKLRAGIDQTIPGWSGASASADLLHDGRREVTRENDLSIGGWTRVDLGLRWRTRQGGTEWTVRAGVDNVFDRRAWRESPTQFAHAYLFPLAPRTARLSLQADL